MALVAVVVLWSAYSLIVIGYDRITSGCGPIKPMLWPTKTGGNLHVKCGGASASASSGANATSTQAASTPYAGPVLTSQPAGTPGQPAVGAPGGAGIGSL